MEITTLEDTILPNTNGRSWYHESVKSSRNLTIVAGDSWTWGDSLGRTNLEFDDYYYRTTNIYGYHLCNLLESDFVNIGMPGRSNLNIIEHIDLVLSSLKKSYDNIQVVATLTEVGREVVEVNNLLTDSSQYKNVWQGGDWPSYEQFINGQSTESQLALIKDETKNTMFGHSINLLLALRHASTVSDLFSICEFYAFQELQRVCEKHNVRYIIGRNFTNTFKVNYKPQLVLDRWVDVISHQGEMAPYPERVLGLTQMTIAPMVKLSEYLNLSSKPAWIPILESASEAIDWLDASPYNSKIASKHPLEQAHRWWAEHLYNKLQG